MNTITIRLAEASDAPAMALVHSISATKAYTGYLSEQQLRGGYSKSGLLSSYVQYLRLTEKKPDVYAAYVAECDDKIIGILKVNIADDGDKGILAHHGVKDASGWFNFKTSYLLPEFQRKGIGGAMMQNMLFSDMGLACHTFFTDTLAGDYKASPQFFEKFGGCVIGYEDVDLGKHYGMPGNDSDRIVKAQIYMMKKYNIIKAIESGKVKIAQHNRGKMK